MKVKIVAFMQNPWHPPGTDEKHILMYRGNQEFHRRILARSMSGARLLYAFGQEMFDKIWWDNASPEAGETSSDIKKPDLPHMEAVIRRHEPHLILTFGNQANDAIDHCVGAIPLKVMKCHHPNARFKTQHDLDAFAQEVRDWVLVMERNDEFTKDDED